RVQPDLTEARRGDGKSEAEGTLWGGAQDNGFGLRSTHPTQSMGNSGRDGLRQLLARLGFDHRGITAEFASHFQELFAHYGVGDAVRHAAGAVGLKTIVVDFEHLVSPSATALKVSLWLQVTIRL